MQQEELQQRIKESLSRLSNDSALLDGSRGLLNTLGYESEKTLNLEGVEGFIAKTNANSQLKPKQIEKIREECTNIELIFQITDEEITKQTELSSSEFNQGNAKSFVFLATDMAADASCTRASLANLTRIINQGFGGIPAIIIFRYNQVVTLSIVHRRPSRRQGDDRDVLSKVTQVKDINLEDPHRAHLDILSELSLHEAINQRNVKNFDGLHKEWERILNSETLSNRFYRDLYRWFDQAVSQCQFPEDETTNPQNHIIRLITRLLFIWFLKEKSLIPDEIFTQDFAENMVNDHQLNNSNYYHAVILNLFFSTLNTEIEKRGECISSKHFLMTSRMQSHPARYIFNALLKNHNDFAKSMEKIPFVNGGLFDNLASEVLTEDDPRFSEVSMPAMLLLDEDNGLFPLFRRYKFTVEENTPIEIEVALDPELMGMVFENLLAAYNPETSETVRKSTGSFYTPRSVVDYMVRQTLTETLLKHVEPKSEDKNWWRDRLEYLLDHSNAKADAEDYFEDEEKRSIINVISNLKTLDPAVGSGAFPMGILQTLILALSRLDPGNVYWKQVLSERSGVQNINSKINDQVGWERKLYLIQNTIYGVDIQTTACQIAKLRFFISLIIEQDPVHDQPNQGIQPLPNLENNLIAADTLLGLSSNQSLIQDTNAWDKWQKQIFETRQQYFLAHDQGKKKELIQKDKNLRKELLAEIKNQQEEQISMLQKSLEQDLDNIPNLNDRKVYRSSRQIQIEKKKQCFGNSINFARDFANWDPYDQNNYANWFNAEHMFGIPTGFDVVIGNPPYIQLQKNSGLLAKRYKDRNYETFSSTGDIYQLFYERGCKLLNKKTGCLSYITSNSWLHAQYGKKLRRFLNENLRPIRVIDMGPDVFDSATVDTAVLFIEYVQDINSNSNPMNQYEQCQAMEIENKSILENPIKEKDWGILHRQGEKGWIILSSSTEGEILKKIESKGTPLREFTDISIYRGVLTGYNKAFIVDQSTHNFLLAEDPKSAEILKPILRGSDIERYQANWHRLWLIGTFPALNLDIDDYPAVKQHLMTYGKSRLAQDGLPGGQSRKKTSNAWFELQDTCAYHENFQKHKVIWSDIGGQGRFSYDENGLYMINTAYMMVGKHMKYLCAFLNSSIAYWYMLKISNTLGKGRRWFKVFVESVPIVFPGESDIICLSNLVDKARLAISNETDKLDLIDKEVNSKIYDMYNFTKAEIESIELATTH